MKLIETKLDIPASYFTAFLACNAQPHSRFYKLKDKILKVFGYENDYDLQHIKKTCHSCKGTGWYYSDSRCRNCSNGVWDEYDVVLKRYILNESIFHIPIGRLVGNRLKIWNGYEQPFEDDDWYVSKWRYENFEGIIKNTINGLIKHAPQNIINPYWAYWYLLHKYDYALFKEEARIFLDAKWNKAEYQKRNYYWLTSDNGLIALAKYYECQEQVEPFMDEVKIFNH